MRVEILATGDEIRSGALVDSNSAHIAACLEEAGLQVTRHLCVGDDLEALAAVFGEIAGRVPLAVVTGGLGPTSDDLTAAAAARAAGVDCRLDVRALAAVEAFFQRRGYPMSASNRKQAQLPDGARMLDNPVGTAPGFELTIGECTFFCLPGVPREMQRMLAEQVLPRLRQLAGARLGINRVRTITTFGLPESAVGEQVQGLETIFAGVKLGLRARFPEIHVRLYASGQDAAAVDGVLTAAGQWVCGRLGDRVLSTEGESLPQVVGRLLTERHETLAVAESCTGGLIANQLTDVPGSSEYFLFAGVTYANAAKMKVLGVSPETLETHGAVSEETVREMAAGARRVAGATYGLATSGIAGPTGGSDLKPVGTVCIGLATAATVRARRLRFPFGQRLLNKTIFAAAALDLLREEIAGA